ncbi:tetratricopeptide repeat protein [Maribacter vaceletii]|uniref:Tetratricopeptide repeat protein n=1 Tax=Maribacter vaceletii TaxID=1206816 RepID=A0A495ECM1_9FLAO|nr:tetratricopeptide repeat protein [Maribacter vaceletii]RKR14628.1 tetratricopeptide repeat protein [Maribacter vaceletii]
MLQTKQIFVLFFLLFYSVSCYTQEVSSEFISLSDSLIKAEPKTYREIDKILRPKRKDTIHMRYFSNTAESKGYFAGQSYALNQLGRRYRAYSQFSNAIALHTKALEAANKDENLEFKVFSLNMLSVVYRRTDAIKTALDYSQEALELAETVKNPSDGLKRSINVSLNGIGNIYQTLEQYDLAIKQFEKSMFLEKELGNELGIAINHQNIGECQESQLNLNAALENFKTSLYYNKKINNAMGIIICKNSIAQINIKQEKIKEAIAILEPTLIDSKSLGDQYVTSAVHINLGTALMHIKNYKDAEKNMLTGLQLAKKHNLPSGIIKANLNLSDLYNEQGKYKKALEYYKVAQAFDEGITNVRNLRYVNDMIIRYDTEKKSSQIEVLAKENEIVKLKLRKNKTTLLISAFALTLLAGIFFILYRQYQLKNEKKLLTLEQTMLRSQMNPHFLFNSLNSIKLYIINNEKKNAVHYLNKFSKLVRKILEASSLKEIPLAEELETVDLYMNIENIRFSNEINFNISIAEDIDTHTIKIPSLILQPFLENALWHGLSSKEGEKNIKLNVRKCKDGFIHIEITDNGVGRAAAEKIKKNKVLKRKSIGIDITKERLTNFSRDYQNSFSLEIIDLYDENKNSSGTQVLLHIPTF